MWWRPTNLKHTGILRPLMKVQSFSVTHQQRQQSRWLSLRFGTMCHLLLLDFVLTRTFGTVSVAALSQRKSSTSSSHDEGRAGGGGRAPRFWSCGTGGAVRLPDPPVLCALRFGIWFFLSSSETSSKTSSLQIWHHPQSRKSQSLGSVDGSWRIFYVYLPTKSQLTT